MNKGDSTKILDHGYLTYIGHWGDDLEPLQAARMSTGNETGVDTQKDDNLRDFLWRHRHDTPFEFSTLVLEVQCPIFVTREWQRHRQFSFNEFSQRYSEALNIYYEPSNERLQGQSEVNKQSSESDLSQDVRDFLKKRIGQEQAQHRDTYDSYLRAGLAREVARLNMPVSNYTKFRVSGNLRNWFHFINLRAKPNAQYEIRVYAEQVLKVIEELWPTTAAVFKEHTLNAQTFGASEVAILKQCVDLEKLELLTKGLGKSRAREFLDKLR